MSFQETAKTLKSRLHLDRLSPSVLVFGLVIGAVAFVCVSYSFVELVASHSFEVRQAQASESTSAGGNKGEESLGESSVQQASKEIVVYVSGSVSSPGVYTLAVGSRVADAVEAAGGFAEGAQKQSINLARILTDEEQVHVPAISDMLNGNSSIDDVPASQSGGKGGLVNINTASVEELTGLDGVGKATAEKIVNERMQNGSFKSIEDIKRVSGIGDKRFEAIKDFICV